MIYTALVNAIDFSDECNAADRKSIKVTKGGQVTLNATVDGTVHVVTLSEVYYAKDLAHILISYCKFEEKGVAMSYEDGKRYMKRVSDGARVFEVEKENIVLVVSTLSEKASSTNNDIVSAALQAASPEVDTISRVRCTLLQLHNRLGNLMYDTVEKVADRPSSGIELVDRTRPKRLTCAQGKQEKNS